MNAEPAHRYAFAPSPCGGVAIEVGGCRAVLRPSGALWLVGERLLVVADLHLEKGSAYASRGQLLPPYDSRETLARLAAEAALLAPRAIVLLGDSFHDRAGEQRLARDDGGALIALAAAAELVWIVGNHDAEGPSRLPGRVAGELAVAGLAFVHQPEAGPRSGEVAGHLHPCAKVKGRAASVRRRCFVTDGERLVMPAFGAFAGGLNVRDRAFRGLFARPPLAIALGERRAHPIGWDRLGGD
ncbi:MAG TPA: ligase-associated DNA damage response endonuclease PdeM [Caulobacteraceae bacterium]|nr:ligase-associated DNA damage response endonuclease PdeM [Caulobacteraceae bacterium]